MSLVIAPGVATATAATYAVPLPTPVLAGQPQTFQLIPVASILFVGATQVGDGQTVQVSSVSVPVHASAVAGDLMVISLDNSLSTGALTTPTGFSILSNGGVGPDINGSSFASWLLAKLLTSADIAGGSILCDFGGVAARIVGNSLTFRYADLPTTAQVAVNVETTASTSEVLPTLPGVAFTSALAALFVRRRSGAGSTTTIPSPYTTPTTSHAGTNYGTGTNVYTDVGYTTTTPGGTVGGETGTQGVTGIGNNYLLEIPVPASSTSTIPLTDTGSGNTVLTVTATVPLADTGAGSDSLTTTAVVPLTDAATAADTLTAAATVPLTESGTGTDTLAVTIPISLTDAGASTDTLAVTATVPLPDTITGADALTVAARITLADTGAAADALTVRVPISLTDSGTATDTFTVTGVVRDITVHWGPGFTRSSAFIGASRTSTLGSGSSRTTTFTPT